jgi:hypothetical protein
MVEYEFYLENGERHVFQISLNRRFTPEIDQAEHPQWTKLCYRQCKNCPLTEQQFSHCPAAVDLEEIITRFSQIISFSKVDITVRTPEREYHQRCDAQQGLYSILGLVMATSECPILSQLRPLANFHLPFATPEETIFRTVGAYMVKQYLIQEAGGTPDFRLHGLTQLYQDLVVLNTSFVDRIRVASEKDANLNAVIRLDSFSLLVLFAIKEHLAHEKIRFYCGYTRYPTNGKAHTPLAAAAVT